ncbi:MAG: hypothetical protein MRJ92_00925 [Nitrospira sp.]|nr:hypothetical protein [Nitrospira sp.]
MLNLVALGAVAGLIPGLSRYFVGPVSGRCCCGMEGGLIGAANGVLVHFFDLMHEATEQTGARDPVSWLVFLVSPG